MEQQEIRKRIYDHCDIVLYPTLKPFEIKSKYGSPCFSKQQDEFIKRYQNGSRTNNTMKFIMGINPIFKLNKKARELLLNDKLHKISPDCCKYLKKVPVHKFEKETNLKSILRCTWCRRNYEEKGLYKLFHKRQEIYTIMGFNR